MIFFPKIEQFKLPLEVSVSTAEDVFLKPRETHHIRNVVRVHLVQVLVVDVGIGKVKPAERRGQNVRGGGEALRPAGHDIISGGLTLTPAPGLRC